MCTSHNEQSQQVRHCTEAKCTIEYKPEYKPRTERSDSIHCPIPLSLPLPVHETSVYLFIISSGGPISLHFISAAVKACTILVPSLNLVRKMRFAFWNMPSLRLTTMNCEPLKRFLIRRPMFCVCDGSNAASTSSRMYIGAGLNCSSAIMSDSATSDLQTSASGSQEGRARKGEHTFDHHSALLSFASRPCRDRP